MTEIVIRADGLGKKYSIGLLAGRERNITLRDAMARGPGALMRSAARLLGGAPAIADGGADEYWALKDLSFEIARGDVVGVIGRNGAGKSTLLKILSRITEPTEGRVEIKGRVASLLEVGTGFHPELTGRENIYLNGAILGMSRAEIKRKFDEIVAFAEVETFLDTPVKRYSSGMYVRLAFAVAAHLEPEILVVDEVLAVGDAEFQKKCLGKMQDVASGGGRTVLFVSHNIDAIKRICGQGLSLSKGRLLIFGPIAEAISARLESHEPSYVFEREGSPASEVYLLKARLDKLESSAAQILLFTVCIVASRSMTVSLEFTIRDKAGAPVAFMSFGTLNPEFLVQLTAGINNLAVKLNASSFAQGDYTAGIAVVLPFLRVIDRVQECLSFSFLPRAAPGAKGVFDQSWGHGSVHLNGSIETVQ